MENMTAQTFLKLIEDFQGMFHTQLHYDVVDYDPIGTPIVELTLKESDPLLVTDVLQFVKDPESNIKSLLCEVECPFKDFFIMSCLHVAPAKLIEDSWTTDTLRELYEEHPDDRDLQLVIEEINIAICENNAMLKDCIGPEWYDDPIGYAAEEQNDAADLEELRFPSSWSEEPPKAIDPDEYYQERAKDYYKHHLRDLLRDVAHTINEYGTWNEEHNSYEMNFDTALNITINDYALSFRYSSDDLPF